MVPWQTIINHWVGIVQYNSLVPLEGLGVSWQQRCKAISGYLWAPHLIRLLHRDYRRATKHTLTHVHTSTEELKTKDKKWNPFWNRRGKKKSINYCNYFNSHSRKDPDKGLVSSCMHTCLLWSWRGLGLFLSTILT